MLSDVLSDAVDTIRTYQYTKSEYYNDIKEWIDSVVREMEALRRYLDLPPPVAKQVYAMRHVLYSPKSSARVP